MKTHEQYESLLDQMLDYAKNPSKAKGAALEREIRIFQGLPVEPILK